MLRRKAIVGTTDFSLSAQDALERAAPLAKEHDCSLTLVHVFNAGAWHDIETLLGIAGPAAVDHMASAQKRLKQIAAELGGRHGLQVDDKVLTGKASREIGAFLATHPADLAVVGAHREGWARNLLVGGTALKVLAQARCPVLMVRRPADRPYAKVLVACDFSPGAVQAARWALDLFPAAAHHLIHVYDVSFADTLRLDGADDKEIERYRASAKKNAAKRLDAFAADCHAQGMAREALPGFPAPAILDQSQALAADVIVIGRHGGSALEERLFGSVTQNVLYHAPCDVLVAP